MFNIYIFLNIYLHSLDHHELLYQWLCLSCQVHGPL